MTHFPHNPSRPGAFAPAARLTARGGARDVLWGRPVFKAPQLHVRFQPDPLPFTATRVTRPSIADRAAVA